MNKCMETKKALVAFILFLDTYMQHAPNHHCSRHGWFRISRSNTLSVTAYMLCCSIWACDRCRRIVYLETCSSLRCAPISLKDQAACGSAHHILGFLVRGCRYSCCLLTALGSLG